MRDIQYDTSPDNKLEQMIKAIYDDKLTYDEFRERVHVIYELGMDDGEQLVWAMRAGRFKYADGTPGPGLTDDLQAATITVSGDGHSQFSWDGKTFTEVHINDNDKD
jgi:hypothetical protein